MLALLTTSPDRRCLSEAIGVFPFGLIWSTPPRRYCSPWCRRERPNGNNVRPQCVRRSGFGETGDSRKCLFDVRPSRYFRHSSNTTDNCRNMVAYPTASMGGASVVTGGGAAAPLCPMLCPRLPLSRRENKIYVPSRPFPSIVAA